MLASLSLIFLVGLALGAICRVEISFCRLLCLQSSSPHHSAHLESTALIRDFW
mgnify:FL=1